MSGISYRETTELLYYLPRFIVLIVVLGGIVLMINHYANRDVDVTPLESEILADRVFYSSACLAYDDGVRTHPQEIDMNKFTNEQLTNCLQGPVHIKVELLEGETISKDIDLFERNEPYCKFDTYTCLTKLVPVIIHNGNTPRGVLKITTIIPKKGRDKIIQNE